jgi:hypothetical protein
LIFLNNLVTVHCARAYCLKRKKQKKRFFLSKVCLTCNFTEALKMRSSLGISKITVSELTSQRMLIKLYQNPAK